MKTVLLLTWATIAWSSIVGCSERTPETYEMAISSGRREIPYAKQFDDTFDNVHHFISYYDGVHGKPKWNSKVGLHDRYLLTLQLDVEFDQSGTRISSFGDPLFHLTEIRSIERGKGGSFSVLTGDDSAVFGTKEWKDVIDANGNLRILGLIVKTDQPLALFDEYWPPGATTIE